MESCHRYLLLCLLGAVLFQPACRPKRVAHSQPSREARGLGFALSYDSAHFSSCTVMQDPRLTIQENGSDIPFDVGPARVHFAFKAVASTAMREKADPAYALDGHITIIPLQDASVPDYDKAYPTFRDSANALRKLLAERPKSVATERSIPDLNPVEASQSFHAKVAYLDSSWCSGVFFITRYEQDSAPIKGDELSVVFQGLSKDGKSYITAELPMGHRDLLKLPEPDPKEIDDHYANYLRSIERKLDQAGDDTFSPPLTQLKAMILSLHPEK